MHNDICSVCGHRENESLSDITVNITFTKGVTRVIEYYVCDSCVREIVNADRRQKYADKHWARKRLKEINKFENRPSEITIMTSQTKGEKNGHNQNE
jgi:hypothetical protein